MGFTDIALVHEKQIDVEAEREKLAKEIAKLDSEIANGERQLDNQGFTTKAPPHIVEGLKKQLDEKRILRDKLHAISTAWGVAPMPASANNASSTPRRLV